MSPEGYRVLQALAWSERMGNTSDLPLRRIADATLGGDASRAAGVLADLDSDGCIHTDTMGWQWGWLTIKGRRVANTVDS